MSVDGEKKRLRSEIRQITRSLDEKYILEAGEKISKAVTKSDAFKTCETLFVYVSTAREPDTYGIIQNALDSGKKVCVPRCGENFTMDCVRIGSLDELSAGTMGIPEPLDNTETLSPEQIELAVIPCMSASKSGARLGHGAGYYDRFLEKSTNAKKYCLCFEKLICDRIPLSEYDVNMDLVITETNI